MANATNVPARTIGVTVGNQDVALMQSSTVGRGPISDISVHGECVVVTNFGHDSVAVLDADTLAVRREVLAGQPTAVDASGDRAFVAVSSASYDAVAVIDTVGGDVVKEYPLSYNVTAITTSSDGKRVFAGRQAEDGVDVAVIDVTAERVGTIYIARGADATIDALQLDSTGRRLYVAVSDARSSRLITVDVETARMRRTLEIGAPIRGIALGMDSTAYVLTSDISDGGVLYVVDLVDNKVTGTVAVAQVPTQLVLSADGARAYVVDYDHVAVFDTDQRAVVASVSVGARPSAVALDGHRLYVADYDGCVTAYAVATRTPMLYSPFVGAPSRIEGPLRELEPAGA